MSLEQVKALANINRRGLNWLDERGRSPKALGDMSGVILSRVGSRSTVGIQDFDYDMLARIYICNDLAWTCINLVSSTAALAKLKVRIKDGNDYKYLPDHPLQKVLDFPNASMTQFDLVQAYVTHQLLFGNVTMLLLRDEMTRVCPLCIECAAQEPCLHALYYFSTGAIKQVMPVHPSLIKEKVVQMPDSDEFRKVLFYCPYTNGNRTEYPIHPDNVLTDPLYNPEVGWYGVSPTYLLKRWLDLDNAMTSQITQFFENGAIPSMIVSLKPGTNFTYEDEPNTLVAKMKEAWLNQFSARGKTEKAPAFVYGDIDVKEVQSRIDDTVGKSLYFEIQDRVCATYGVPPTLYEVGMATSSQKANASQGEKDFYNRTISKVLTRLQQKINHLIVPSYNTPNLEVGWDISDLGIASFLTDIKEKRITTHWQLGLINRNETRAMLGYEPVADTQLGDDYYRLTVMGDGTNSASNQLDNNLRVPGTDPMVPSSDTNVNGN
jgi:HK97 family phage portal protein